MKANILFILLWLASAAAAQTVELSGYVSAGQYSGGGNSLSFSEYLKIYLDVDQFLYLGHNNTVYRGNQAFSVDTRQDLINVGGLFKVDEQNYLNAEYYHLDDSRGVGANMFGAELTHVFDSELSAGMGLNYSSYSGYQVQQVIPRLVWRPDSTLSLNSRIYLSHSDQRGTYLALVEKLQLNLSPELEFSLGGGLGPTLNRIDNDISTIFTQPQLQTGSWLAGCTYRPDPDIKLQLNFERDYFQGYSVNYIGGGLGLRF